MGDFVKIFNSLDPLKFFTENYKIYRNLAQPLKVILENNWVKIIYYKSISLAFFKLLLEFRKVTILSKC